MIAIEASRCDCAQCRDPELLGSSSLPTCPGGVGEVIRDDEVA